MDIIDLKNILKEDSDILKILTILDSLKLNDSWLCAGTIRNFVWNYLAGIKRIDTTTDIDIVFFDKNVSNEEEQLIEKTLKQKYPGYTWELKNQVYMHQHNPNTLPYKNSTDAISKFPETCTAIGIRLDKNKEIEIFAPYGIDDIIHFNVHPTPYFLKDDNRTRLYNHRVTHKNWKKKWSNLNITTI